MQGIVCPSFQHECECNWKTRKVHLHSSSGVCFLEHNKITIHNIKDTKALQVWLRRIWFLMGWWENVGHHVARCPHFPKNESKMKRFELFCIKGFFLIKVNITVWTSKRRNSRKAKFPQRWFHWLAAYPVDMHLRWRHNMFTNLQMAKKLVITFHNNTMSLNELTGYVESMHSNKIWKEHPSSIKISHFIHPGMQQGNYSILKLCVYKKIANKKTGKAWHFFWCLLIDTVQSSWRNSCVWYLINLAEWRSVVFCLPAPNFLTKAL